MRRRLNAERVEPVSSASKGLGTTNSGTQGNRSTDPPRRSAIARAATIGAIALAIVTIAVVLISGGNGHDYKLIFQTGGQLVPGNEVLIGGSPAGSVKSVKLTPDNRAAVEIDVDQQLHQGTTAVVRATSLSGVANHYVSISPAPDTGPAIPDGATLGTDKTTSPVDLDQLFDTLDAPTRRGLRNLIRGSATIYAGKSAQANQTYKYLAPALSGTDRLLEGLGHDQRLLTRFVVSTSKVVTTVAERHRDLTGLVSNANTTFGAIAGENTALAESLNRVPPTLRQANTTFVNLRAALGDLDSLVNTAKPATRNLEPFLEKLRPVTGRAVGVFGNLALVVNRPGPGNDLQSVVNDLVPLHKRGAPASRAGVRAIDASQPTLTFARPYAPDLIGSFAKLGAVSGYYDGDGNYARVQAAAFNLFRYDQPTENLVPIPPADKFNGFDVLGSSTRCPGGATQPVPGSNPFLDQGNLVGKCDPSDVPPGP